MGTPGVSDSKTPDSGSDAPSDSDDGVDAIEADPEHDAPDGRATGPGAPSTGPGDGGSDPDPQ
jgi:hypothetical protein